MSGYTLRAGLQVLALTARPTGAERDRLLELRRHPESHDLLDGVWRLAST